MRYSFAASTLLAAASVSSVAAEAYCPGAQLLGGNWYCEIIESIVYNGFAKSGTFKGVKSMGEDGSCEFDEQSFDSAVGVFGDELSLHLRGPAHLKKLAVYSTDGSSSNQKRELHGQAHAHAHVHARAHQHGHAHAHQKRAQVAVTATMDGQVVSWMQEVPDGVGPTPAPAPAAPAAVPFSAPQGDGDDGKKDETSQQQGGDDDKAATTEAPASTTKASSVKPTTAPSSSSSSPDSSSSSGGPWTRLAYYDAASGSAEGLVFLNHHGGEGSGVFDTINGNSLSYASKDAKSGASSPQVMGDILLEDNNEIVIMSDKKCDGDCGAVRPGTVAHHGFAGANKVFVAELDMPLSGKTGFNADMPSWWILNAAIPRTAQYGTCSCWKGGCGEFDILEVLDSGNKRCKSTIHAVQSGGDSNYFDRPTDKTVHVAVVFDGSTSNAHIKILDSFSYPGSLDSAAIKSMTEQSSKATTFSLGA
ncbi:target of Sbf [Ascosphaera acerosa]|nr:target of Sbf [Ascosphaera acerosa]